MGLKSNSKLIIFVAIGFIIIWFLEFQRTSFVESYWLLLVALSGLMAYQYMRLKNEVKDTKQKPVRKQKKQRG